MCRRHRPSREKLSFSFDSFLDVVTNVVGIIIKLILVTWVGARSYTAAMALLEEQASPAAALTKPTPKFTDDSLHADVQRNLNELEEARARLVGQLRKLEDVEQESQTAAKELNQLDSKRRQIDEERAVAATLLKDDDQKARLAHLSLDELRLRGKKLLEQIKEIEKLPAQNQVLRYHTPVSRTVRGDELFFECRGGKITFIDLQAFLHELQAAGDNVVEELRNRNKVERVTSQVGAFRLRYFYEKEGALGGSFRYGITGWRVETMSDARGETLDAALAANSDFRRVADAIDPNQTVVTFWVYPDSFELFRRLRDFLYEREVEVAGRPLPPRAPIAASRSGTKSRGQ
ncbi:MAG: hypothetical protein HY040_28935 [Planctomycetes bacterium]|nr:hypothetical protein [Planctomycetota bacterium]